MLFPTPLPAKIPTRCPCPNVSIPSIARTPVEIILLILGLFRASGGEPTMVLISSILILFSFSRIPLE